MKDEEFLRSLVECYTPSGKEEEIRNYLASNLPKMGFEVDIDDVGNVIARTGPSPRLLLTSHMDTVKGEIPVRIESGSLYGRGSVDAKGPLAAMFLAASKAESDVEVAAVVEEENTGRGARYLVENRKSPEFLVNGEPSGWESVTLGYRGILKFRYESTSEVVHTARPEKNPIEETMRFWRSLQKMEDGDGFDSIGTRPTYIRSDTDGFEFSTELHGTLRIPPRHSVEEMMGKIEEKVEKGSLSWEEATEPVIVDQRNQVVRSFLKSIRDCGGDPSFSVKTGTSDMNVFAEFWDCPMVTYGPGDSNLDHSPNEHIEIDEFLKSVDVLKGVIEDIV